MKNKCSYIQLYLSDFIKDSLSSGKKKQIRDHIRLCLPCQSELKLLKRTNHLLGFYVSPDLPNGYNTQLLDDLQQLVDKRSCQVWWRVPAFCREVFWRIEDLRERLVSSVLLLINQRFYNRWIMGFVFFAMLLVLSSALFFPQLINVAEDHVFQANVTSNFLEVSSEVGIVENRQLAHNRQPIVLVSQWNRVDKRIDDILKQRESIEMKMGSLISDRRQVKPLYSVDESDFVFVAQPAVPTKADRKVDYALPSSVAFSSFSKKIKWRRLGHTNRILNNLSVARVFDPVRL